MATQRLNDTTSSKTANPKLRSDMKLSRVPSVGTSPTQQVNTHVTLQAQDGGHVTLQAQDGGHVTLQAQDGGHVTLQAQDGGYQTYEFV